MTDAEEKAYLLGERWAWIHMLQTVLQHLGRDSAEWSEKRWLMERESTIQMLRSVCKQHGDNDWEDELTNAALGLQAARRQ